MGMDMFGIGNKPAMAKTQTPQQGAALGGGGGNSILSAVGGAQPMGKLPNAMGQGFAQQQQNAFKQKMQERANPMMKRPGMSPSFGQPMGGGIPTPMLAAKAAAGASAGQGLGPSMEKPQYGLQDVASRMGYSGQNLQNPAMSPPMSQAPSAMQAAQEQMRGYDGPDMGSQDPRELARMGQMPMNQVPELPVSNYGRPDVMPRIGPSNPMEQMGYAGGEMQAPQIQMDENGLEPRRGAR